MLVPSRLPNRTPKYEKTYNSELGATVFNKGLELHYQSSVSQQEYLLMNFQQEIKKLKRKTSEFRS